MMLMINQFFTFFGFIKITVYSERAPFYSIFWIYFEFMSKILYIVIYNNFSLFNEQKFHFYYKPVEMLKI